MNNTDISKLNISLPFLPKKQIDDIMNIDAKKVALGSIFEASQIEEESNYDGAVSQNDEDAKNNSFDNTSINPQRESLTVNNLTNTLEAIENGISHINEEEDTHTIEPEHEKKSIKNKEENLVFDTEKSKIVNKESNNWKLNIYPSKDSLKNESKEEFNCRLFNLESNQSVFNQKLNDVDKNMLGYYQEFRGLLFRVQNIEYKTDDMEDFQQNLRYIRENTWKFNFSLHNLKEELSNQISEILQMKREINNTMRDIATIIMNIKSNNIKLDAIMESSNVSGKLTCNESPVVSTNNRQEEACFSNDSQDQVSNILTDINEDSGNTTVERRVEIENIGNEVVTDMKEDMQLKGNNYEFKDNNLTIFNEEGGPLSASRRGFVTENNGNEDDATLELVNNETSSKTENRHLSNSTNNQNSFASNNKYQHNATQNNYGERRFDRINNGFGVYSYNGTGYNGNTHGRRRIVNNNWRRSHGFNNNKYSTNFYKHNYNNGESQRNFSNGVNSQKHPKLRDNLVYCHKCNREIQKIHFQNHMKNHEYYI